MCLPPRTLSKAGLGVWNGVRAGKLTTILAQFGAQEANVRSEVDSARSYCKYRNLPPALKKNVTDYFEVRAAQRAVCDEQAILRDMSPSLKARVRSPPLFMGEDERALVDIWTI